MRIAIDLTALLPQAAGVDNFLRHLVIHLAKIDCENQYRIYMNYEDRAVFGTQLPLNFRVVPVCLRPRPARLIFQQIFFPALTSAWDADVVHSPAFILPFYRGKQRHVLTIHDMSFFTHPDYHIPLRRSNLFRRAVLQCIRVADLVTVPSVATQTDVLRFVPELSEERVRVIAHGVGEEFKLYPPDEIERSVRRLRLPASYILYVGTIEPRKNISTLVESYRRLVVSEGISEHLLLVGQLGWKYKQVLKKLNAQELRGRVHQIGYMPQEDLPWIYAGARLFVYPSVHEGFGFPPLEAMACGVPTISSLSSSMTENLHGAAELFPPDNVEALTEAIRRLLYDEWARKDLRQKGLVRAATYCWDETARKTVQCYRAAIR